MARRQGASGSPDPVAEGQQLGAVTWRTSLTCPSSPRHPSPSPQLWYFWRRRLFIWISFVDSYFEILLYVGPGRGGLPLPLYLRPGRGGCSRGHQTDVRGEDPGPESSRVWDQRVVQRSSWGSLCSHPYRFSLSLPCAPVGPHLFTCLVSLNPHKCTMSQVPLLLPPFPREGN